MVIMEFFRGSGHLVLECLAERNKINGFKLGQPDGLFWGMKVKKMCWMES